MRLRALTPQVVRLDALDLTVHFGHREELRTEVSAKFTRERLESDLAAGALELESFLTDDESRFALSVIRPA
jgi:L-histidine N-alpha-methyltransferase